MGGSLEMQEIPLVSQSTLNVLFVISWRVTLTEHVKLISNGVAHSLLAIVSEEQ